MAVNVHFFKRVRHLFGVTGQPSAGHAGRGCTERERVGRTAVNVRIFSNERRTLARRAWGREVSAGDVLLKVRNQKIRHSPQLFFAPGAVHAVQHG
jgi:hypothetical protein